MMVLSGANITMFITFISSILFFLPQKIRDIVAIILTCIFLSFIPMQPSIVRAALMNYIPRIGVIFGKQSHGLYLLFFTCALILCFDSQIVYDISFQLSFLAILGISLFYKNSAEDNKGSNIVNMLMNPVKEQITLGFSAQVFTVPLIFYYFGNISLASPIANLLLSPLISPIMISTIMVIISGNIFPIFTHIFGLVLKMLVYTLLYVIHFLSQYRILYIQY
jgi:competence protein ComEC